MFGSGQTVQLGLPVRIDIPVVLFQQLQNLRVGRGRFGFGDRLRGKQIIRCGVRGSRAKEGFYGASHSLAGKVAVQSGIQKNGQSHKENQQEGEQVPFMASFTTHGSHLAASASPETEPDR